MAEGEYDESDPRRLSPSELRSGGVFGSPAIRAARDRGVFWPGEFVCPVVLAAFPPLEEEPTPKIAPTFLGTATLIGGDLFLSARHVFFDRDGQPYHSKSEDEEGWSTRPALAVLRLKEKPDIAFAAVEWVEAHPDRRCDLVIGKLVEWDAAAPWSAIATPTPLNDVTAVGYPYERMAILKTGDLDTIHSAFNSPRYVKGYVTRGNETAHDPFMPPYSFEVSFRLTPGMSGCPLWWHDTGSKENMLYGIAIGSLEGMQTKRETRTEPDGTKLVTETVLVEDYGQAVRIDAVLEWEIAQLGSHLFDVLASRTAPKQT